MRPTIRPASTSRETSSIATIPPNRRVTLRISSSAIGRELTPRLPRGANRNRVPARSTCGCPCEGDDAMNGMTRAGATLLGAAGAGALLWVAAQFARDTNGSYWAAYGIVAGAGVLFAVTQWRG